MVAVPQLSFIDVAIGNWCQWLRIQSGCERHHMQSPGQVLGCNSETAKYQVRRRQVAIWCVS